MYTPSDFIETLPNTTTRKTYRVALLRFLEILSCCKINDEMLDKMWIDYLTNTVNPENDLLRFFQIAETKYHLAPKTIRLYVQIATYYMRDAGLTISDKGMRIFRTRTPKNQPITREAELNRTILHQLIENASLRLKVEIIIAVSSGMRIREILMIRDTDIDLNDSPASIYIPAENTKNRTARTVFISREAVEYLQKWFIHRESLQKTGKINKDESRIFPYSLSNEIANLRKCLNRCGLLQIDNRTNRATIHFHLFRKYFLTEFKLAASSEAAEELAGHNGYLSESYRRLSRKTLKEEYKKAEPNLTIVTQKNKNNSVRVTRLICDIQKKIDELNEELNVLHRKIERMG